MRCTIRVKRVGIHGAKFDNLMVKKIIRCHVFSHTGSAQVDEAGVTVHLYDRGHTKVTAGHILGTSVGIHNENIGSVKVLKLYR